MKLSLEDLQSVRLRPSSSRRRRRASAPALAQSRGAVSAAGLQAAAARLRRKKSVVVAEEEPRGCGPPAGFSAQALQLGAARLRRREPSCATAVNDQAAPPRPRAPKRLREREHAYEADLRRLEQRAAEWQEKFDRARALIPLAYAEGRMRRASQALLRGETATTVDIVAADGSVRSERRVWETELEKWSGLVREHPTTRRRRREERMRFEVQICPLARTCLHTVRALLRGAAGPCSNTMATLRKATRNFEAESVATSPALRRLFEHLDKYAYVYVITCMDPVRLSRVPTPGLHMLGLRCGKDDVETLALWAALREVRPHFSADDKTQWCDTVLANLEEALRRRLVRGSPCPPKCVSVWDPFRPPEIVDPTLRRDDPLIIEEPSSEEIASAAAAAEWESCAPPAHEPPPPSQPQELQELQEPQPPTTRSTPSPRPWVVRPATRRATTPPAVAPKGSGGGDDHGGSSGILAGATRVLNWFVR